MDTKEKTSVLDKIIFLSKAASAFINLCVFAGLIILVLKDPSDPMQREKLIETCEKLKCISGELEKVHGGFAEHLGRIKSLDKCNTGIAGAMGEETFQSSGGFDSKKNKCPKSIHDHKWDGSAYEGGIDEAFREEREKESKVVPIHRERGLRIKGICDFIEPEDEDPYTNGFYNKKDRDRDMRMISKGVAFIDNDTMNKHLSKSSYFMESDCDAIEEEFANEFTTWFPRCMEMLDNGLFSGEFYPIQAAFDESPRRHQCLIASMITIGHIKAKSPIMRHLDEEDKASLRALIANNVAMCCNLLGREIDEAIADILLENSSPDTVLCAK